MRLVLRWLRRAVMVIGVVTILIVVLAFFIGPKNDEAQKLGQSSETEVASEQPASATRPSERTPQATVPILGPDLSVDHGSGAASEKDGALGNSRSRVMREVVSPEVGADRMALNAAPVAAPTSDAALSCPEPVRVELDYDQPVSVQTIAADAVEQWGLRAEGLDVVPKDKRRNFYWTLSAASALSLLARDAEWTWYREGDAVQFVLREDPILRVAGVVPSEFAVEAERAEGGLLVSVVSDLDEQHEVTVTVDRVFASEGGDDERSWQYLSLCGLAGQWREPRLLLLDDEEWADGLQVKQDQMARLGPDVAFEIDTPSKSVWVTARYRSRDTETAVLMPLSVPLRTGPSPEVGAEYLKLRQSYLLRNEVPLTGLLTDPSSRAGRLSVGDEVRVLAAERSGPSPKYLVEADGRRGWISSIALMPEGATRVSGLSEADRRESAIYEELWGQVWQPCVDFAHALVAATRGEGAVRSSARRRVVELMLPWLEDVAAELEDLGVDELPETEASALYRGLRMRCRNGSMSRGG